MSIEKRAESIMVCIANIYNTGGVIQNDDFKFIANQVEEIKKEIADVQPIVDTKNMATVSDEFICKKCGLYLKDYPNLKLMIQLNNLFEKDIQKALRKVRNTPALSSRTTKD